MKWKRKNITTSIVLSACNMYHKKEDERFPNQIIMDETKAPYKIVMSAMLRDLKKGYIDYGVSLRTAWVTDKGREYSVFTNVKTAIVFRYGSLTEETFMKWAENVFTNKNQNN